MRKTVLLLLAIVFSASVAVAQSRTANTLDIYVIDVEGGNAVLFAAPSGKSVLGTRPVVCAETSSRPPQRSGICTSAQPAEENPKARDALSGPSAGTPSTNQEEHNFQDRTPENP